jgi:hypothetical protein
MMVERQQGLDLISIVRIVIRYGLFPTLPLPVFLVFQVIAKVIDNRFQLANATFLWSQAKLKAVCDRFLNTSASVIHAKGCPDITPEFPTVGLLMQAIILQFVYTPIAAILILVNETPIRTSWSPDFQAKMYVRHFCLPSYLSD